MQAVGIAAAVEDAAGEFVHDLDQTFLHDIVHVYVEKLMRPQGLGEIMDEFEVAFVENAALDEASLL